MNLMHTRLIHLGFNLAGYLKTGVPLIEFDGTRLLPSFTADDIGIYVLIPKIAALFNISLESAIDMFFYGLLFGSCVIGIIGVFYLYQSWFERFVGCTGLLLLTRFSVAVGDVYLAFSACCMSLLPWAFYYFYKKEKFTFCSLVYIFLAGFSISLCHYIRAYSGFAVFLTLCILVFFYDCSWQKKLVISFCFFLGIIPPVLYMKKMYHDAKTYVNHHMPEAVLGEDRHVFWHNVYIGFGFLDFMNPDDICYDDSCGMKKVASIDPTVTIEQTQKYESILKKEVFKLIRYHWKFVLMTIFAKLGILIFFMLKFANFGLLAAWFYRKTLILELAFLVGLLFNSLFPLLVMPMHEYTLGFICYATLYGIISINYALSQGLFYFPKRSMRAICNEFKTWA
jgi:hypothetical protein